VFVETVLMMLTQQPCWLDYLLKRIDESMLAKQTYKREWGLSSKKKYVAVVGCEMCEKLLSAVSAGWSFFGD
jgi:hypothetical protein